MTSFLVRCAKCQTVREFRTPCPVCSDTETMFVCSACEHPSGRHRLFRYGKGICADCEAIGFTCQAFVSAP